MASVKLMTPQNKPQYFKLTANIMVDGIMERRYSRFDFDPKKLRTAKSRTAAATAAAMEFERREQELVDQAKSDANKSFAEVAKEYILDSKARLAPSARLRGDFDSRKNKANTTRNKESYLNRIINVCPWFADKPVSQITKADYKRLMEEIDNDGIRIHEKAFLLPEARKYKIKSFNKLAVGHDITAYTMAEAFRGKHVSRHSAEEISKALGVQLEQAFRIEGTETTLTRKTLREYALFARQVLQFASDQYGTVQPAFTLPARGSRPRYVDCLHEDEVKQLLNYLPNCSMLEQTIILSLLNTGMRRGELAGLTWEDVNFKQCTVHVYKSLLVFDEFGYQLTTTKESNDRYIDVAPEFMEFMKRCYELWKCQRKMMGASWQNSIEKKRCKYPDSLRTLAGNNFVICDDHGWPLSPDSYASIVKRIGDKAGIRHLHPHMFRHTFVSILMANPDIGVATVAAEAGHAQPSTTLMIYTQQYKKRQESIRNQLSRELYGA